MTETNPPREPRSDSSNAGGGSISRRLFPLLAGVVFFLLANPFADPPDCAFYLSWAATLFGDLDVDFSNQFVQFGINPRYSYLSPTGIFANDWPIGTGLVVGPSLLFHPILSHAWVMFLALAALALWTKVAAPDDGTDRNWVLGGLVLGTPLGFYLIYGPFFAHLSGFVAVTAFLSLWAATRRERPRGAWLILGVLLGFSATIRPQNILVGVVLIAELVGAPDRSSRLKAGTAPLLGGLVAGLLPLYAANWVQFGSGLWLPKTEEMRWLQPAIFEVLFSDFHGVIPWTPIHVLGFVGLVMLCRRDPVLGVGLSLVWVSQLFVNAANLIWWAGGSFGNRRLVDVSIVVAWGLLEALRFVRSKPRLRVPFLAAMVLMIAWTVLLVLSERRGFLPLGRYIPLFSGELPSQYLLVVTEPAATARALLQPFLDARESGIVSRAAAAVLLVVAVAALFRLGPRIPRFSWHRTGLVSAGIALALALLVAVAGSRTEPMRGSLAQSLRWESSILWDGWLEYSLYQITRNNGAEAATAARRAIEILPERSTGWWYLALAQLLNKDEPRARAALAVVLELDPGHERARYTLRKLDQGINPLENVTWGAPESIDPEAGNRH